MFWLCVPGPLERAGVRVGDRLVAIGGQAASHVGYQRLLELIDETADLVTLRFAPPSALPAGAIAPGKRGRIIHVRNRCRSEGDREAMHLRRKGDGKTGVAKDEHADDFVQRRRASSSAIADASASGVYDPQTPRTG